MTATDDLIAAIERQTGRPGKRSGKNIRLLCPAHDDHDPSLDVAEGETGWPLTRCRSHDCTFEQICLAVGHKPEDFAPTDSGEWTPRGTATAVYDYTDADGHLLYQVCRTPDKQFPQRRPDPTSESGWRWNLEGVDRVLYRLPEVLDSASEGGTVYITEGEKDADAIRKAGAIATCSPGGAGNWRDSYAPMLHGAHIIIVADKDEPGVEHAHTVAASLASHLNGTADTIQIVQAKEGKDAYDHLAAGLTLDQFVALDEEQPSHVFSGLTHSQVLALEFPAERMLVDDLIPIGAVGTIAGVPETYKSWQAQAIAVGIAAGEGTILGKTVAHAGPVGYFWQDDSTREEAERIKLYDQRHGSEPELDVRWFLNEGLRLPEHIGQLAETIAFYGLVLVVLDSFYNILFGGNLKDEEAEQVVAMLKTEIADKTGCTVLIVDHMPWATEQNRKRLRAYGGVFKNAATRFGIYIDAAGNKMWAEARGNNITGFKRTPVEWDPDTLELRLVDVREHVDEDEYERRVLETIMAKPGLSTTEVTSETEGDTTQIKAARLRLLLDCKIETRKKSGTTAKFWYTAQTSQSGGLAESEVQQSLEVQASTRLPDFQTPLRGESEEVHSGQSGAAAETDDIDLDWT